MLLLHAVLLVGALLVEQLPLLRALVGLALAFPLLAGQFAPILAALAVAAALGLFATHVREIPVGARLLLGALLGTLFGTLFGALLVASFLAHRAPQVTLFLAPVALGVVLLLRSGQRRQRGSNTEYGNQQSG
ncbi:MAG: hypothetical protein KGL91_10920 [Xanthomonadaceae bacterium]|nr:hypothetical protein [Xanthomonadaceae bacterium]